MARQRNLMLLLIILIYKPSDFPLGPPISNYRQLNLTKMALCPVVLCVWALMFIESGNEDSCGHAYLQAPLQGWDPHLTERTTLLVVCLNLLNKDREINSRCVW
jgi:hypothetical protein